MQLAHTHLPLQLQVPLLPLGSSGSSVNQDMSVVSAGRLADVYVGSQEFRALKQQLDQKVEVAYNEPVEMVPQYATSFFWQVNFVCVYVHVHIQTHAYMCMHAHAHVHTHTHTHTYIHMQTHIHTVTHAQLHMHSFACVTQHVCSMYVFLCVVLCTHPYPMGPSLALREGIITHSHTLLLESGPLTSVCYRSNLYFRLICAYTKL